MASQAEVEAEIQAGIQAVVQKGIDTKILVQNFLLDTEKSEIINWFVLHINILDKFDPDNPATELLNALQIKKHTITWRQVYVVHNILMISKNTGLLKQLNPTEFEDWQKKLAIHTELSTAYENRGSFQSLLYDLYAFIDKKKSLTKTSSSDV